MNLGLFHIISHKQARALFNAEAARAEAYRSAHLWRDEVYDEKKKARVANDKLNHCTSELERCKKRLEESTEQAGRLSALLADRNRTLADLTEEVERLRNG